MNRVKRRSWHHRAKGRPKIPYHKSYFACRFIAGRFGPLFEIHVVQESFGAHFAESSSSSSSSLWCVDAFWYRSNLVVAEIHNISKSPLSFRFLCYISLCVVVVDKDVTRFERIWIYNRIFTIISHKLFHYCHWTHTHAHTQLPTHRLMKR